MTRRIAALAIAGICISVLPGCFPMAVTGMGAAALMANDRRTTGIYVEDENIEWKVVGKLRDFPNSHVNATSFNRRVLLTGEVPDEATRTKLEETVKRIDSVREVTNELRVGAASSLTSRGNDALVTSNVKARMVNNGRFSPNHVKVVTEQTVVYLMGLVTQPEADAAVEITRTTQGVARVVKVFEYIS